MKTLLINARIFIVLIMVTMISCGKNQPKSDPEAEQLELLSKSWSIATVSLDGENVLQHFSGFQLSVNSNYTYTSNSDIIERQPNPWLTSGTFEFAKNNNGDVDINKVIRDGSLPINIAINGEELTLSFTFDEATHSGTGRINGVSGNWVMTFN